MFAIVFSGLRYEVGTDYSTYEKFLDIIKTGASTYMEPGFELVARAFVMNGFSNQWVFFICSFVTIVLCAFYLKKYSLLPVASLLLFLMIPVFFFSSFNAVRQ